MVRSQFWRRWPTSRGGRQALLAGLVLSVLLLALLVWLVTGGRDDGSSLAGPGDPSGTPTAPATSGNSDANVSPDDSDTSSPGTLPEQTSPSGESPAVAPEPIAPDATFRNTCRYVVGDSTENSKTGSRFVATSRVANTGNTGIEVEIQASWSQGQGDAVTETKRARVDEGESTTVRISVPVSQKEIDAIRLNVATEPNCRVQSSIIATY